MFHGDHGWHLGEQGGWCKQSNFDLVARVPLVVHVPWLPASQGTQSSALVEIVDLFPTTLDLFNITHRVSDAPQLEGTSFMPLLLAPDTDPAAWKNATFTQYVEKVDRLECETRHVLYPFLLSFIPAVLVYTPCTPRTHLTHLHETRIYVF